MAGKRVSIPAVILIGILALALAIAAAGVFVDPWSAAAGPNPAAPSAYDRQAAQAEVKALSNKFATAVKNERKTASFLPQARAKVRQYRDLVPARVLLAQVLMRSGRLEKAADQLEQAVEIDPDQARVRELLGAVWEKLGDLEAAKSQFSQATSLSPENAKLRLKLANAQLKAGDMGEARTTALIALRFDSNLHQAHVLLSQIYERQGRANLAESQMARALEQVPHEQTETRVTYVRRRAKLLRRANRPKDALSVLRELSPRQLFSFPVAKDVARTFGMLGQPLLAAQHYATLLNLDPGNQKAARLAVRWYLKGDDLDSARDMLGKFQQLSPNSKALTELRQQIRKAAARAKSDR